MRADPLSSRPGGFEQVWRDFAHLLDELSSVGTLFVLGPQRSGTTWVQQLVNAHPECACGFELRLHDSLMAEVHRMIGAYNSLVAAHSKHVPGWAAPETRMLDQARMMLVMRAMFLAHFYPLPKPGLRYVGEKTPENLLGLSDIEQVFPDARYIVVIRDGRDAGLSSWHHFREHGSPELPLADFLGRWVIEHWSPYATAAMDLRDRLPDRVHLVRYEELARVPMQMAEAVFAFLGVDASRPVVARCVEASSFETLSGGRHPGEARTDDFFRSGMAGEWRRVFGPQERAAFAAAGATLNRRLGYED
jgi:hypothetical protein